jgi:uncharacterized protein (TIRG00374 family)
VNVRPRIGKLLSWGLAIAALLFVAWVVPLRDRCWDARAPASTKTSVSRDDAGCVLHLESGDVRISPAECGRLQCEPGVGSALVHARLGIVAALLGLYAVGTLAWAARWRALLDFADIDLSLKEVWRVSVEAQAGGILLPGGIGGDALRIAAVVSKTTRSGARASGAIVVASVLLARAVGLSVVAGLAASLGFAFGKLQAGPLTLVLAAIPIAVFLGLLMLRYVKVERFAWVAWLMRGRVGRTVDPMLAYLRDPRALRAVLVAVGLSVAVAATQLATIRGLVFALGDHPVGNEKWIYVGTAMAFIVAAVPALPGGWGTADAAYVFFFGLAGLSAATALAVCLVYRLFWYLCGVVGAVLYLARPQPPRA